MEPQGALSGTRFLATPEAPISDRYRQAILDSPGSNTIASKFFDDVLGLDWPGAKVRAISNELLDEWAGRPDEWAGESGELQPLLGQALMSGDFVLAGEASGLVAEVKPAGDVVREISADAAALLASARADTLFAGEEE